jgi:S-ribosylhomocysteine lyase LuxS involved in autoinducer biosynthesis
MPFIPTNTKYVINGRVMGGTMRSKVAKRTKPSLLPVEAAAAAAGNPTLPPPEDKEEDVPVAKKPRLQAPSSVCTTVDGVTTEHTAETRVTTDDTPTDDIPTDPVTPADSSASAAASPVPRRHWNTEEDTKLTEAVKKHGKKWVAIATMVPGRTSEQCRSRWAHTLDPVAAGKTAGRWKPEEDAQLIDAVKKHGTDWVAVATLVPGRADKQCRKRWTNTFDPVAAEKTAGRWKPEEDTKLIEAVKKHGKQEWVSVAAMVLSRTNHNWVAVAELIPGRTATQCRNRWVHRLDPVTGKTAGRWKPEEDEMLIDAVKKHGTDWVAVAPLVPGRTGRQCRDRWVQTLHPVTGKPRVDGNQKKTQC